MGGRLKDRVGSLVKCGYSAYEMDNFREIIMINHKVLRSQIAGIFGVHETAVTKWFTDCTIDSRRKGYLFEKYRKRLLEKWVAINPEENFVYALAWASSKLRKEILKKLPKHEKRTDLPQSHKLEPRDCVYMRCALENRSWCRGVMKNNSKILLTALEEINIAAKKSYEHLLLAPENPDNFAEPLTQDKAMKILHEWKDIFELIVYLLPCDIYEYRICHATLMFGTRDGLIR
jgi:hypothetical protein